MQLRTYQKGIIKTYIPKQMYKKTILMKKGFKTISNIDILNRFLTGLKGQEFNIYSDHGFLVLKTDNKTLKVMV